MVTKLHLLFVAIVDLLRAQGPVVVATSQTTTTTATTTITTSRANAGCDEGWLNHGHFCYYLGLDTGTETRGSSYQQSVQNCQHLGAHLASIWTREERTFLTDVLWQPCLRAEQHFAWFGLHGTSHDAWAYEDHSDVIMGDGVLTSSGGEPAHKESKCGAFTGSGGLAFLDCMGMRAQGYICKKALSRLFASSELLNHTIPSDSPSPARGSQLFERVWPPLLEGFPDPANYLAENDADSETGCAFRCYNVHGCKAFLVTCIASDMCKTVMCTFYK